MEKEKVRRGPKPKDANEKKVPVKFWVKQKHYDAAHAQAMVIEQKFNKMK